MPTHYNSFIARYFGILYHIYSESYPKEEGEGSFFLQKHIFSEYYLWVPLISDSDRLGGLATKKLSSLTQTPSPTPPNLIRSASDKNLPFLQKSISNLPQLLLMDYCISNHRVGAPKFSPSALKPDSLRRSDLSRRFFSSGRHRYPRRRSLVVAAGPSHCEPSSLNTPLVPRTAVGKYLSGVLQNQPLLFHMAVAEELKRLADDRDSAVARMVLSDGSDEACLHRYNHHIPSSAPCFHSEVSGFHCWCLKLFVNSLPSDIRFGLIMF